MGGMGGPMGGPFGYPMDPMNGPALRCPPGRTEPSFDFLQLNAIELFQQIRARTQIRDRFYLQWKVASQLAGWKVARAE